MDYEVSKNGICVTAMKLPDRKNHVLGVQLDEDGEVYAVGTLKSEADARWFIEILAEMLKGEDE